ncbi:MAG TPA: aspartyl protease family protein [Gemmataceae bacterium]|nr:aspartyl protease family protein [Gemmataceae bacterium]
MPHLTFPTTADGPTLEVVVSLAGHQLAALQQAGAPFPRALPLRGLIDTGTDVTAIAPRVVQQLGLISRLRASTQTAAGQVKVNLYEVSLTIAGPKVAAGPILVRPTLLVTELAVPLSNLEILVGRDVLDECLFGLDGPGGSFLLGF